MLFGLVGRRFKVDFACASECGPVRRENQDHLFADARSQVFCVADGMGGGDAGGEASDAVCRSVESALSGGEGFDERVRLVDEAIRRADCEIRSFAAAAGYRQMGSTAAVLVCDGRRAAAVGNVGDSRVYRMRAGKLSQLTRDHTVAEELQANCPVGGARPLADTRWRAYSHVLTRAVGVGHPPLKVDWNMVDVADGDVMLVCSDGVHGVVSPSRLAGAMSSGGRARDILERVLSTVLAGGAHDNYSAIVVKIGGAG